MFDWNQLQLLRTLANEDTNSRSPQCWLYTRTVYASCWQSKYAFPIVYLPLKNVVPFTHLVKTNVTLFSTFWIKLLKDTRTNFKHYSKNDIIWSAHVVAGPFNYLNDRFSSTLSNTSTPEILACLADAIYPRLVTSAKKCRYSCSGPQRTQRITGIAFQILFHPNWQIYNDFF